MVTISFQHVLPHGCGMGIHKEVMVATIRVPGYECTKGHKTFTSSLTELKNWLVSLGVTHVAMESTGVFGSPSSVSLRGISHSFD